jgi:glutamate N-acetyltransferase / amino-acid N-acetyltransferase
MLGLAKGSGMIHPDMATMLGFLFSDVDPAMDLGLALRAATDMSFNRITVDGDTSTNDAVILWSSQRKSLPEGPTAFMENLDSMSLALAKKIAADGEGASKLVRIHVSGASTQTDARQCASTIATSLLVKTAVHGEDPNWGRILAAAGRANVAIDTRKVKVGIGKATLFAEDYPRPEEEPAAREHLEGKEILIWIDLGCGVLEAEAWTCDLSADYVRINADYRT